MHQLILLSIMMDFMGIEHKNLYIGNTKYN